MRRRDFLGLVGATAAWPLAARAQQTPSRGPGGRPWLIGAFINASKAQSDIDSLGPFIQGLAALGYVEGGDYRVEARYADSDVTRYPAMAKEIVAIAPDLILAGTFDGSLTALTETIPIVTYISGSIETVLPTVVGTTAKPVANVTGIINDSARPTGKHCELALEAVPTATRIGILSVALDTDRGKATKDAVAAAALARKFTPVIVEVLQPSDLRPAFQSLADQRVDVAVVGSGVPFGERARAAEAAAAVRLPTIYNEQGYVESGGLISYGFDRKATFVRLASFADLILKGRRPRDIPVEEVSAYVMAINLKTAKSLGLTIPPTVIFRADEVIQ